MGDEELYKMLLQENESQQREQCPESSLSGNAESQALVGEANVSALINSVNMPDFREWCALLEKHGYQNFLAPQFPYPWGKDKRDKKTKPGILNSKHYGVAQNRERVYMLSVRRDILGPSQYEFPRPFALDTCIADVLEDNVDERFFLKPDSVIKFLTVNEATDASDIHYMVTDHKLTDEEIREARKG